MAQDGRAALHLLIGINRRDSRESDLKSWPCEWSRLIWGQRRKRRQSGGRKQGKGCVAPHSIRSLK